MADNRGKILGWCLLCTVLLVGMGFFVWSPNQATAGKEQSVAAIEKARTFMAGKHYKEAAKVLNGYKGKKEADRASYLLAYSHFKAHEFSLALNILKPFEKNYKGSIYAPKARMLEVRIYLASKDFTKAEALLRKEALSLLSEERKREVAGIYLELAKAAAKPKKGTELIGAKVDYDKALRLYNYLVGMDVPKDILEKAYYQRGAVCLQANRYSEAINYFTAYLQKFDPYYRTEIKGEQPGQSAKVKVGKNMVWVRLGLVEAELRRNNALPDDNVNQSYGSSLSSYVTPILDNLIRHLEARDIDVSGIADQKGLDRALYYRPLVAGLRLQFQATATSGYQAPGAALRSVNLARKFIKAYPQDVRALELARLIPRALKTAGFTDDALVAYEMLIKSKDLNIGGKDKEKLEKYQAEALYAKGDTLFSMGLFGKAETVWANYLKAYPNGGDWNNSQEGIYRAKTAKGATALSEGKFEEARKVWQDVLSRRSFGEKAAWLALALACTYEAEARAAKQGKDALYERALEEIGRVGTRYRDWVKSKAHERRANILHYHLKDLDRAVKEYRAAGTSVASNELNQLTAVKLGVETPRVFRNKEAAHLKLKTRNVDSVKVRLYKINLEDFFRKYHSTTNVRRLDLDLVSPDRTWEEKIPNYKAYKEIDHDLALEVEGPGAYAVTIEGKDYTSTVLAIKSDIEIITAASKDEVIALVKDGTKEKGVANAKVTVWSGPKKDQTIVLTTDDDGVAKGKFKVSPSSAPYYFAQWKGSVAVAGAQLPTKAVIGLKPRGYIYPSRPVYLPGETVPFRGIIRAVGKGTYKVEKGAKYKVTLHSPDGRAIGERQVTLGRFGTFDDKMKLPNSCALGHYTIRVSRVKGQDSYATSFQVQRVRPSKIYLELKPSVSAAVGGDIVDINLKAAYYTGLPLVDRNLTLTLPDGRIVTAKTDKKGEAKYKLDTTPFSSQHQLSLAGRVAGENVGAAATLHLLPAAVKLTLDVASSKVTVGQRVDVPIVVETPDGKPMAGQKVTARVYYRARPACPDVPKDILRNAGVAIDQWLAETDDKLVEETFKADNAGRALLSFVPKKPGSMRITATTADDKGREATVISNLTAAEPPSPELAFSVKSATVSVGDKVTVDVTSKDKAGLGLLLFTGDRVLSHKLHYFKKGKGSFGFTVSHTHFPSMRLIGLAAGDQRLNRAEQRFDVKRRLVLSFEMDKGPHAPGEKVKAQLIARDQKGKPVEAEFSIALVDKGVLAKYPDTTPNVVSFFEDGLKREAEFKCASSITFKRVGEMKKIAKEVLAERQRVNEMAKRSEARRDYASKMKKRFAPAASLSAPAPIMRSMKQMLDDDDDAFALEEDAEGLVGYASGRSRRMKGNGGGRGYGALLSELSEEKKDSQAAAPRREFTVGALWLGSVVTNEAGKAQVTLTMPERTSSYRVRLRGVSEDTLLGEKTSEVVIRRDLYADLKIPEMLMEGDQVRAVLSLHNNGGFKGTVTTAVKLTSGTVGKKFTVKLKLDGPGIKTKVLPAFKVPAARRLTALVTAKDGNKTVDSLEKVSVVRPWGVEERDGRFGTTERDLQFKLELPANVRPETASLELTLFPGVEAALLDMADSESSTIVTMRERATRVIALLRVVEHLGSGKSNSARIATLLNSAQGALGALLAGQKNDGSWGYIGGTRRREVSSDIITSAWALLALDMAQKNGLLSEAAPRSRALQFVKRHAMRYGKSDERTFYTQFALAAVGAAEFSHLNRLFRDKRSLKPLHKVLLGLAFVARNKMDYAKTLAEETAVKAVSATLTPRGRSRHFIMPAPPVHLRALSLALLRYVGGFEREATLLSELLRRDMAAYGVTSDARWLAMAALATGGHKSANTEPAFDVELLVNGKKFKSYEGRKGAKAVKLTIPAKKAGGLPMKVTLKYKGRGILGYRALLTGFAPVTKRRTIFYHSLGGEQYYHSPKLYRGRELTKSSMHVKAVENEDFVEDYLWFTSRSSGRSSGDYLELTRWIPAGMTVDKTSIPSSVLYMEENGGKLTMLFRSRPSSFRLRLLPYCPGTYRVLPARYAAAERPADYERLDKERAMTVLAPGEALDVGYEWTSSEHRQFGEAYFNDGNFKMALHHLSKLKKNDRNGYRDVVRALLWIYCMDEYYADKASEVVDLFEVLAEKYSNVNVPYEKLLVIGRAYHDVGEDEAACYLWRSTLSSSFRDDVPVASELEQAGEYMRAVQYLRDLYWRYPDEPNIIQGFYGLSQDVYAHKNRAREYDKIPEDLVYLTLDLLRDFLALFADEPYADEATFSQLNALRDLEAHEPCIIRAEEAVSLYPKSTYVDRFRYIRALAAFHLGKYDQAIEAAAAVAKGLGQDSRYATYLLGQMYQALGKFKNSLDSYRKVQNDFSDAKLAIEYLERRFLSLPEVVTGTAGKPVNVDVTYCNATTVEVMAYRVDLMRLYLKEKNLDRVAGVNLAGITPTFTFERELEAVQTGTTGKTSFTLPIKEVGAYLVLARSNEVFASCLALVSPLTMEVQEYQGSVRVTVLEGKDKKPVRGVHVKASNGYRFVSGETDLRGTATLAIDGGQQITVVSRRGKDEYAFYRSTKRAVRERRRTSAPAQAVQFDANLESANMMIQQKAAQQLRGYFGRRSFAEQGVRASAAKR